MKVNLLTSGCSAALPKRCHVSRAKVFPERGSLPRPPARPGDHAGGTGTILRDITAMLEAIGLEGVSTSSKQGNLLFMTRAFGKGWTQFEEYVHLCGFAGMGKMPAWSAQSMMRLGLIDLKARPPHQRGKFSASRGWIMGKARRTEWGEAVTRAIVDQARSMQDGTELGFWIDLPEMNPGKILKGAFQPFFSEFQNDFDPPKAEARLGTFVFRVGYHPRDGPDDVWRELAVPHDVSLPTASPCRSTLVTRTSDSTPMPMASENVQIGISNDLFS